MDRLPAAATQATSGPRPQVDFLIDLPPDLTGPDGNSRTEGNSAEFESDPDSLGGMSGAKLVHHIRPMDFDRARAELHPAANLFVGAAHDQLLEDLALACRQGCKALLRKKSTAALLADFGGFSFYPLQTSLKPIGPQWQRQIVKSAILDGFDNARGTRIGANYNYREPNTNLHKPV